MQINCPECDNSMSIGSIKAGRYQPKCKKCSKPFVILVTDDDPPKIKVGKAKAEAVVASANTGKPTVMPQSSRSSPVDATMDSATSMAPGKPTASRSAVDATMAPDVDATMDGSTSGPARTPAQATIGSAVRATKQPVNSNAAPPASKSTSSASRSTQNAAATAVDATMEGAATMAGAVQATLEKSSSGVRQGKPRVSASQSANSSAMSNNANVPSVDIPEKLGGYRILRLLGRGAMGAVYEAKQVSLDRNVALKTIRGRLADNPSALARFTREAYAAAQLVHHNVVQIYDFGQDAGQHYFSMEWVRGGTLSDVVRDQGPCDPRVAATYTLQAARGLQFAHRHGMVHRDVKPANLLLNEEGVVKVADLGLVKVPDQPDPESDVGAASHGSGMASGTQVTMMGTAVGTPAYMAPEQGVDATTVDHRADIYSLGCSLFFLLSGKAPFDGSQVSEVMKQHAQSPIPKIQSLNRHVPEQLGRVIERSMAKRPEDRYPSLADMITDLENFLGLQTGQGFSPSHQQADRWEELSKAFAAAPLAKLQTPATLGLIGFAGLLLLLPFMLGYSYLLMAPTMLATAFAVALVLGGSGGRSIVATRVRAWLGSLSWFDYVVGAVVSLVVLLVVLLIGMWPGLLIGGILGAAAGAAYQFILVAPLQKSRLSTTTEAEKFVRDLRIQGIDEAKIRDFSARYSGKTWKPLFEELFGYEAMSAARASLLVDPAAKGNAGNRTIRDWVCTSLQTKTEANRAARDHKRLATLEENGLKSEGLTAAEAKERAWQMASAMMDAAKVDPASLAPSADPRAEADLRRNRMKAMMAEARSGQYKRKRDKLAPLRFALGGKMRLLAGCALLALSGFWVYKNVVSAETIASIKSSATSGSIDALGNTVKQGLSEAQQKTELPPLLGTSGWAVGIAGLLMATSSFISGWRVSLFAIPAVIVAIFGPSFGIPSIKPLDAWMIACAGAFVLMIPGVLFGESGGNEY